jgi:hypothetical protein
MVLVATEPIPPGGEVRIDYEVDTHRPTYWLGGTGPPKETEWRDLRVPTPPPTPEEPVIRRLTKLIAMIAMIAVRRLTVELIAMIALIVVRRLTELRLAAASCTPPPPCTEPQQPQATVKVADTWSDLPLGNSLPWEGAGGGDARLQTLVPMLTLKSYEHGGSLRSLSIQWAMLSTHLPGRSGKECRERWQRIRREAWAAVVELDPEDDGETVERCAILGCKKQLLQCNGAKDAGQAVGCAENSHTVCMNCLDRWFASRNQLRQQAGLATLTRRTCPVCQSELRAAHSELRGDAAKYMLGLEKLRWTWP